MSRVDELPELSNLDKLVLVDQLCEQAPAHTGASGLQEEDKLYERPMSTKKALCWRRLSSAKSKSKSL